MAFQRRVIKCIQGSDQWLLNRQRMITATDISKILELNSFQNRYDLLKYKLFNLRDTNETPAMIHGKKFETYARVFFENMMNVSVNEYGLIYHNEYDFLGASPDGIFVEPETNEWVLLEIKCPYSRDINGPIPFNYQLQIQWQMEVCDLNKTYFLQCQYNKDTNELINWRLNIFKRNKEYINNDVMPFVMSFWRDLQKLKNIYNHTTGKRPRKIHFNESNLPQTLRQLSLNHYIDFNGMLCVSGIVDYMNDDPLLMYLNLYGDINNRDKDNFCIKYRNVESKRYIDRVLVDKFSLLNDDMCKYTVRNYLRTRDKLSAGSNVILNPLLVDLDKSVYGSPSLIGLGSWIRKFVNIDVELDKHYPIVIKNTRNFTKGDYGMAVLYCDLLSVGCDRCIFIDGLGEWCLYVIDEKIKSKVRDGLKFWDKLKTEGDKWNVITDELYPNMCNHDDYPWHNYKKFLANLKGELTQIWGIGLRERKEFHKMGIYDWKKIPLDYLDMTYGNIVRVNRERGLRILGDLGDYDCDGTKYFIDFETVNDLSNRGGVFVYLIGVIDSMGNYNRWWASSLDDIGTKKIMREWIKWLNHKEQLHGPIQLLHWHHHERSIFQKLSKLYRLPKLNDNVKFYDLLWNYFIPNKLAVKGSYTYKLKDIARALRLQGKIKTQWKGDIDGEKASIIPWLIYDDKECPYTKDELIYYNEIDCRVLYEIDNWLKSK